MEKQLTLILLMAVANASIKMIPVHLLSGRKLPKAFVLWLKYVPVPVLSGMLASDLLMKGGRPDFSYSNLPLFIAIPTFGVAYFSRNLFVTVLSGMAMLAVARYLS